MAASPLARTDASVPALCDHQSSCTLPASDPNLVNSFLQSRLEKPSRQHGTARMIAAASCAQTRSTAAPAPDRHLAALARRYALSTAGPICMSAAHFVAAVVFLRAFTRVEFGLFSFLLVLVPFCFSLTGALIGAPAAVAVRQGGMGQSLLSTYLKMNLVIGTGAGSCACLLMWFCGAGWTFCLISAAYAAAMTVRWFARTLTYARGPTQRVLLSDIIYSIILVTALLLSHMFHLLTMLLGVQILFLSCFVA